MTIIDSVSQAAKDAAAKTKQVVTDGIKHGQTAVQKASTVASDTAHKVSAKTSEVTDKVLDAVGEKLIKTGEKLKD